MKTIFSKKILACVLAVCMLFTMCAGALSVSAETLEGSATIGTAVYDADGTVVPVTFTAADIGGADLRIKVPTGLTITKVELVAGEVEVTYLQDADSEPVSVTVDDAETTDVNEAVSEIAVYTREGVAQFIILDDTAEFVGQDEVVINLTFAGELTEEVAIAFANGTMGGNVDEGQYELALTDGKITIPHVHTPGEPVRENEVPATCDADGSYDEVVYCTECDKEISREAKTIEALGHSWDEGVVTTEPDCDDAGVKTYTCSVCGTTKTEAINALGHTEVPVPAVDPTCVDTGLTAGTKCSVCDAVIDAQEEVPATGKHTYEDGKCSVCGAADPNAGPALDENITPGAHAISIGETFGVGFRFQLDTIDKETYKSFKLHVKRTTTSGDFNFTYEEVDLTDFAETASQNLFRATTTYYGIQLFSLTAPIEYTLHCYDADGKEVAYSQTFTTTLAQIAVNYHDSISSVPIKKVMADLIQVGAAALKHYTSNGERVCDYSSLPIPTIESDYITTELGALADFEDYTGVQLTITPAMQASVYYNMRFTEAFANKDHYDFDITYYNALTKETVIQNIDSTKLQSMSSGKMISAQLSTFPIFATNADVTFELKKDGVVVGTAHYSVDDYIQYALENISSATLKTLLQEVGELGQSIRAARNI